MKEEILIVEDDVDISGLLKRILEDAGYETKQAYSGTEALLCCEKKQPDLIMLDLMLPGVDGFEICKKIREEKNTPIIMVSAKKDDIDKIRGLGLGADDYMTKPFSPSELVARVDAIYRRVALAEMRTENNFKEEIHSGEFSLNLRNRYLLKRGQPIELTQVEFQIMEYFFSNPATALDRTDILKHVWGESYFGEEKIVDVNIRRLRMKVEDEPSNPKHIVTVWGLGYKWEA